jgi:hypothetical protein
MGGFGWEGKTKLENKRPKCSVRGCGEMMRPLGEAVMTSEREKKHRKCSRPESERGEQWAL